MNINTLRVENLRAYCAARGFNLDTPAGRRSHGEDLAHHFGSTPFDESWQTLTRCLTTCFSLLPTAEFESACQSIWQRKELRHWIDLARIEQAPFRFFVDLIGEAGLCFEGSSLKVQVIGHSEQMLRCRISDIGRERLPVPLLKMIEFEMYGFIKASAQQYVSVEMENFSHFADLTLTSTAGASHRVKRWVSTLSLLATPHQLGLQIRQLHQALRMTGDALSASKTALVKERALHSRQSKLMALMLNDSDVAIVSKQSDRVSINLPMTWDALLLHIWTIDSERPIDRNGHRLEATLTPSNWTSLQAMLSADTTEISSTDSIPSFNSEYHLHWVDPTETIGLIRREHINKLSNPHQSAEQVNQLINDALFAGCACTFNGSGHVLWRDNDFNRFFDLPESTDTVSLKTLFSDAPLPSQVAKFFRDMHLKPVINRLLIRLPRRPAELDSAAKDLLMWARVVQDEQGLKGIAIFLDASGEVSRSVQNAHLHERLARLESEATLGRFSLRIAHDLGNLLSVTHHQVNALETANQDHPSIALLQQTINDSHSLTRELLAFGKVNSDPIEQIDLIQAIQKSLPLFRHVLPTRISLRFEPTSTSSWPMVAIPATTLRNILLNLIINARDAIASQGDIRIDVKKLIHHFEVSIIDSGHGISAELQPRVFDTFKTTKESGHGLGLPNVRDMVRRHQGDLILTRSDKKGTVFTLHLPHASEPAKGFNEGPSPLVLIIDPDHSFSNRLATHLESLGCSTILSTTGADGLTQINRKGVYLDCVVTRMVLPGEGGHRIIDQALSKMPNRPVIVLAEDPDAPYVYRPVLGESVYVLNRPSNPKSLAAVIIDLTDQWDRKQNQR